MSDTKVDFLYLSEKDMIKAGVLDAKRCIDVMEEVVGLISDGDYIMGGPDKNSHGLMLEFPESSSIKDFPLNDSRDRRFIAMPAYLGGRFHSAGEKWYGSNGRNAKKGLPRSILMFTLNDVETGAPKAYMSANLLSAMRTGSMPALAARYLAKKDSKTLAIIGPGVISRACIMTYLAEFPTIDTIKLKGSSKTSPTALKTADFIRSKYPQVKNITICDTLQEAVTDADIVSEAASISNQQWPFYKKEWFKPGSVVISLNAFSMDKDEMVGMKKVVDNAIMYEEYMEEDCPRVKKDNGGKRRPSGCMGEDFLFMVHDKMIPADSLIGLGDIVRGKKKGRTSADEVILVAIDGMPVEDVAWGYECYHSALAKGIGTSLNLWEEPTAF